MQHPHALMLGDSRHAGANINAALATRNRKTGLPARLACSKACRHAVLALGAIPHHFD